MATATDGMRAHDILLSFEPLSRHGACWYYVWQAYAAAGASTGMGSSPTAYDGWNLSSGKHPGDRNPPPGAAIWLGRRYDGNMDGDVFIAGAYNGDHAATDQPVYGQTGTTTIEARMNLCGREYLGWTDHVLDCPIIIQGNEDDMTPEEHNWLSNVYTAIFYGGPSMPDGGLPIGQTLADLAAGTRPVISRSDNGDPYPFDNVTRGGIQGFAQELADVKTLLLNVTDRLDALTRGKPDK